MPNAIQPDLLDARKSSQLPVGPIPPLCQGLRSRVRYTTAADPEWKSSFSYLRFGYLFLKQPSLHHSGRAANPPLGFSRAEELRWGAAGPEAGVCISDGC